MIVKVKINSPSPSVDLISEFLARVELYFSPDLKTEALQCPQQLAEGREVLQPIGTAVPPQLT